MIELEDDDEWWLDEAYDWSEELYYDTLADYFNERYERFNQILGRVVDCE